MKYIVVRRTFEAKAYPKGSLEREKLNSNNRTSEYFSKYKYIIREENNLNKDLPLDLCETKSECMEIVATLNHREKLKEIYH